jgi:hypothetical protein
MMNFPASAQDNEAGILARLIQQRQEALSPDPAKYLLPFRFGDADL